MYHYRFTRVYNRFTIGLIVRIAKRPESHQCRPYCPESLIPVFPSNRCCFHGGLRHQGQKNRTSTQAKSKATSKSSAGWRDACSSHRLEFQFSLLLYMESYMLNQGPSTATATRQLSLMNTSVPISPSCTALWA